MATQRCPKCNSDRIRQGYKPTSLLMKLMFRYNLLCNQCNWEFKGFALPGTVSTKTKKRKSPSGTTKLKQSENEDFIRAEPEEQFGSKSLAETEDVSNEMPETEDSPIIARTRVKKRVKVKFTSK